MVLLKWLIVGLTTWSGASGQALAATHRPAQKSKAVAGSQSGAIIAPTAEGEPMRRLSFAGAMLTGFGALMLLHGGKVTRPQKVADAVVPAEAAEARLAIMPSLGGMAMAAGIMLAGLGARRPAP